MESKTQITKDYGMTINPETYIRILQGHQYIPQADQCIRNILSKFYQQNNGSIVLDLGCGPGRLTRSFKASTILGLDISETFIKYARLNESGIVYFGCSDFIEDSIEVETFNSGGKGFFPLKKNFFDAIVMQGVMHHIHGDDRKIWLEKCFSLLKPDGILIVGDEFIAEYKDESDRRLRAAAFYLHIIAEAKKGGFQELADEESKNFIDDVLSGEKGCGFADDGLLKTIHGEAISINSLLFANCTATPWNSKVDIQKEIEDVIHSVRIRAEEIADAQNSENFNRGDRKVSISAFVYELNEYQFYLEDRYEIGPVHTLGGMGVLVFTKK